MTSRRPAGHRAPVNAVPSLSPEISYRREPSPSLSTSSYLSIEDSLASTSSQAHLHLHHPHNLTASSSSASSSSRPNRRGGASTTHPYALQQDAPDVDIDLTQDESLNTSSTSSSTSTTTHVEGNDTDSLIDASDEQVEQRALEFLNMPLPGEHDQEVDDDLSFNLLSNPTLPISLSSTTSNPSGTSSQMRSLRVQDLPRQPHLNAQSTQEQHQQALSFLQNQLAKLSDTDWIDETPAPFQHHAIADPRKVAAASGLGSGGSQGGAWLDQRFNLERYAAAFEDEPIGLEDWQPSGTQGRFADSDQAHAML